MLNSIPRKALLASAAQMHNLTSPPDGKTKREKMRANRVETRSLTNDPLLTAKEAAAEAGVALSTFWKHVGGRFPQPVYPLPRCPRWRRSKIQAAVQGGV